MAGEPSTLLPHLGGRQRRRMMSLHGVTPGDPDHWQTDQSA